MLFVNADDFFTKAGNASRLSREDEKSCALQKQDGDAEARERIIESYLPMVASHIKRLPPRLQTLKTVYTCIDTLEKGVDSFNFLQDGETFTHHLSWRLRQCITRCLVDRN